MAEYNIMNLVTKKILEINPIYSRYKDTYDVALIDEMLENIEISTPILKIVRDTVGRVLTIEKTVDDVDEKQFEEIIKRYEHIENIKKFIERTCYTMYYGFTVHEKIYDFDENNNLYLKSLEYIPREYILFDNGVYKVRTITGNIEIDENKFIISTYDEDINHPLGQSLFRYGLFQAYNDLMTLEDQIRGLQEKYGDTIVVFPYIDSEGETEEGIAKINERIEQMKDLQGGDVLAVPVPRDAMGNVNMKDNVIFISLDDLKIDMHITLTDRLENKINDFLMGADYSSSDSTTGSYARDKVQEDEKTKIVDYTSDFICDELDKILLFDSMLYNYNPDDYEFKLNIERSLTDIYSMEKLEAEKDTAKAESKIKISEGVNSSIESIKNLSRNMGYESGTPSEEMINEISMIYGIDKNIVSKIIQNSTMEFEKKKDYTGIKADSRNKYRELINNN